jgi:hypothetical protein
MPDSAAAGALFDLNDHCRRMFSLSGTKVVHLMGHCCPFHLLKVKNSLSFIS